MRTEAQDIVVEALKATPAVAATALSLNSWIAIATLTLIVLQVAYLIRKWMREETDWGRKLKRRALRKSKGEDEDDTDMGPLG